jgi:hypothetical protein
MLMSDKLLVGFGRHMIPIPHMIWHRQMARTARKIEAGLSFMSDEHHLVRDFVVRELPKVGKPLSPEFIAQKLNLSVDRVKLILDKLEKRLTFLFRNEQGAVVWAYPVTVENTPHHAIFSTGEQVYSA